jgi:phenylalanyl-tRNA synthetase beta chain
MMKISHNWLKEYIPISLKPAQLAERLSMLGLEVEGLEDLAGKYEKFVVGEVVEKLKHPNADKLTLCKVNVGRETVEIICGAPNVAPGQKVPVALVGATIPRDQHDPAGGPFVLERARIRGVESNGMICSEYELGLGDDTEGIMVLADSAKVGTPLAKHLGASDVVYDLEITANRGDWLSHIGVAREIQAITGKKATLPNPRFRESSVPTAKHATIKILDPQKCRRYSSRILRKIVVGPSPKWLQDRLTAVGIRPINNVVDVTNYILMETGQPLHAFDYDTLVEHTIVVQCAAEGERFTTLDGKERALNSDILMICDAEKRVAVAGVMGGANTEISDRTTTVLLESANFEPSSIRRASKFLGLSTDASQRFERGVDVDMTVYAVNRAAQLLQELAGAEVLKGVIDVYPRKMRPKRVRLRVSRANAVLGTSLSKQEIVSYLKRLDLRPVAHARDSVTFAIPSCRYDLEEEIDLIEEVARVYGYDKIETKTRTTVDFSKPLASGAMQDELRGYLIGAGYNEMLTYSLQDQTSRHLAGEQAVEVLNPVSIEASVLRTSLIPGGLQVVRNNRSHGQKDLRLFEIGNVFRLREGSSRETLEAYEEEERVLVLLTGSISPTHFSSSSRDVDFFDLKGEAEAFLAKFCLDKYRFISYDNASALIESALAVEINGSYAGFLGKINKSLAEKFDIDDSIYVVELKTAAIQSTWSAEKKLEPLPRFPSVRRDLAFIVDSAIPQEAVEEAIREAGGTLLSGLVLFDLYAGEQIGGGKKSLAYALEFQPNDRTLTDGEVDGIVGGIVAHVRSRCRAVLRSLST